MMIGLRRTPHLRTCLLAVLLLLACSVSSSWAIVYHVGKYSVDVEVRNSIQLIVPDAKVDIWVGSKNITVEARAAGYLSKAVEIPIGQATYYKRIVNLQDPQKQFTAEDINGGTLSSVYFRNDQYGIRPDKYGIVVSIPEAVWPDPKLKKVRFYDPTWGISFKYEGSIDKSDGFCHVHMVISRKLFGMTGKQWIILFDTRQPNGQPSQNPQQKVVATWLQRLESSERLLGSQLPDEADPLDATLFEHLDRTVVESLGVAIPSSLSARYAISDRFRQLHRDQD